MWTGRRTNRRIDSLFVTGAALSPTTMGPIMHGVLATILMMASSSSAAKPSTMPVFSADIEYQIKIGLGRRLADETPAEAVRRALDKTPEGEAHFASLSMAHKFLPPAVRRRLGSCTGDVTQADGGPCSMWTMQGGCEGVGCTWSAGSGNTDAGNSAGDTGGSMDMPDMPDMMDMPKIKGKLYYDSQMQRIATSSTDGSSTVIEDWPSERKYTTGTGDGLPKCEALTSPFMNMAMATQHVCKGTDAVTVNGAEVATAVKYEWVLSGTDMYMPPDLTMDMTQTIHVKQAADSGCTAASNGCLTNCAKPVSLVRYHEKGKVGVPGATISTEMTIGFWNVVKGIPTADYARVFTPPAAALTKCDKCKSDDDCRGPTKAKCDMSASPKDCVACTASSSCAKFAPLLDTCTSGACVLPPPPPPPPPTPAPPAPPAHECEDDSGCTTAAKAHCAKPSAGNCYESYYPHDDCTGYKGCGFLIEGGFAAGQAGDGTDCEIRDAHCAAFVEYGVVQISDGKARCVVETDSNDNNINTCQRCWKDEHCADIAGGKTMCKSGECIVPQCPDHAPSGCQCATGLTYCTERNGRPVDEKWPSLLEEDLAIKATVELMGLLPNIDAACQAELKKYMCECFFWECKADWKKKAEDCAANFMCSSQAGSMSTASSNSMATSGDSASDPRQASLQSAAASMGVSATLLAGATVAAAALARHQ